MNIAIYEDNTTFARLKETKAFDSIFSVHFADRGFRSLRIDADEPLFVTVFDVTADSLNADTVEALENLSNPVIVSEFSRII